MKRLSNILNESVWSDIHKRSNGTKVKKEDDVNLMDSETFFDYVYSRYNGKVAYCNMLKVDGKNDYSIQTEIVLGVEVSIIYHNNKCSYILIDLLDNAGIETTAMINDFDVSKISPTTFDIKEKNGSISNQTYVNLIDFLLQNKDIIEISESIWADIHKRSNGVESKKEDKHNMNIHMMNPVDLGSDVPVYFADIDLEVNGETEFTWEEVLSFIPEIEKTGWELLCGPKGVQYLFYNGNQPPRFKDEDYEKEWIPGKEGILRSRETKEELHFYTDNKYGINYWCVDDDYTPGNLDTISCKQRLGTRVTQRGFEVGNPNDYNGCLIRTNNFMVDMRCRIRLIKDK